MVLEVKGEVLGALWKARKAGIVGEVALGSCLSTEVMAKGLRRTKAMIVDSCILLVTLCRESQSDVEEELKAEAMPRPRFRYSFTVAIFIMRFATMLSGKSTPMAWLQRC